MKSAPVSTPTQTPATGDLISRDHCFFKISAIEETLDGPVSVSAPSKAGAVARDASGNEYPAPELLRVPISHLKPAGEIGEQTIWS